MKIFKNNYWILLLAVIFSLSACEDYLNTPPVDKLAVDDFYFTPVQLDQGVAGVYWLLRQATSNTFWLLSEMRSDNMWAHPVPNGGFRPYSEVSNFRALPSLAEINDGWNLWYQIIFNANTVLSKIPDCDFGTNEALKNQFLGELYFLRGWAYFELARLYGNIPIIDSPMTPEDVANVSQSTAKEVYERMVIPDLTKAKDLLPLEQNLKNALGANISASGRANKLAATAMLGRVYMTMTGFPINDASKISLAKAELKAIIDYSEANGNKWWAPDSTEWRKQWMAEYNNKYSIFAIQHRSGGTGNTAIGGMSFGWPSSYSNYRPGGTEAWVEKSLAYEYTKVFTYSDDEETTLTRKDARGYGYSLYTPDWPAGFAPGWTAANAMEVDYVDLTIDGITLTIESNSYFCKYYNNNPKRSALGFTDNIEASMLNGNDWPVNYPIIRYEDILLMYAEILAGEGSVGDGTVNTTTALGIMNKIRVRAGCTPETNAAKVMDFIKRERRLEFAGEGIRWFDIVRWGEWRQTILNMFERYADDNGTWPTTTSPSYVVEGRHLYPIPEAQNNVKPGFYTQNQGYNF